jgi:hypothetical protein
MSCAVAPAAEVRTPFSFAHVREIVRAQVCRVVDRGPGCPWHRIFLRRLFAKILATLSGRRGCADGRVMIPWMRPHRGGRGQMTLE